MPKLRIGFALVSVLTLFMAITIAGGGDVAEGSEQQTEAEGRPDVLSPVWGITIRQWSAQIALEAEASGLDPDFMAAVIQAESNGLEDVVSRVGAVGLMGIMPSGPGLEWRPSPEALLVPQTNLNWGAAILSSIIRQSGGDISAALAAYSGGWDQVNSRVPRQYANQVLDLYGRAVAARSDVSPDIASSWTIAAEIRAGHIPPEDLLLSEEPLSGLRTYGEHVVYRDPNGGSGPSYVKGYAVPLALVVSPDVADGISGPDEMDDRLLARLGLEQNKKGQANSRILLSCLPSISRLRGRAATRWYAPSDCPEWHR